jgi:hypothetical protein
MADIMRVRSVWSNFPGAPGYTDVYSRNTALPAMTNAVRAFFDAIKTLLPTGTNVQTLGSCETYDEATGTLTGSTSSTSPAVVVGTVAGNYAGGSGAVISWTSNGFVNGRRVRGRSFIVPLAGAVDSSGSLSSSAQTTLQTAANGLITAMAGDLVVWHRPSQFSAGSSHPVVTANVPDLCAVLRSRRT